ncbi:MAG: wax ester/triacylglycerol synthase family O-acyltransferase [Candidatus Nanopelagicales bacterium]|nr:wax ester/triacylglycerol synthase family O-acyltransferase [Candidatus Nanopelagicales bacterium]
MEQLTGLDAAFLLLETRTTTGNVGGVLVLDDSGADEALSLPRLTRLITQRLPLVPLFRRRLMMVPFGLDHPYWIEDPDFDLEFHVRHTAIPAPGSDEQLAALIARLHARPLDLRRPLWEFYLISGLSGGRVAVYTKTHHCAIDGASGAELLTALLDLDPAGRDVPGDNWKPEQPPDESELLLRAGVSLARQPWNALKLASALVDRAPQLVDIARPHLVDLLDRLVPGLNSEAEVISSGSILPPTTLLNQKISAHRRWTFGSLSLDEVKTVKNAYGMTVNDVVMAMSAGALRRWLKEHGDLPAEPLAAMVPVSVRAAGERAGGGNKISPMLVSLPTNVADPVDRLRLVHEATTMAKANHAALPEGLVENATEFMVPGLLGRAARMSVSLGLLQRANPSNLVISNVPGPNVPIYLAGARMLAYYPVSSLVDGLGLNLTVLGYLGGLHFGLLADREIVPDVADIFGFLADELAALLATVPR